MTTQDVGFADEVSEADRDAIISAARARLAAVAPASVTVGPARVLSEGIGFTCPCCGATTPLFPPAPAQESIWAKVGKLASIPVTVTCSGCGRETTKSPAPGSSPAGRSFTGRRP